MKVSFEIKRRLHVVDHPEEIPRNSQWVSDYGIPIPVRLDLRQNRFHLLRSRRMDHASIEETLILIFKLTRESYRWHLSFSLN